MIKGILPSTRNHALVRPVKTDCFKGRTSVFKKMLSLIQGIVKISRQLRLAGDAQEFFHALFDAVNEVIREDKDIFILGAGCRSLFVLPGKQ
jgi:hypothetical protein